MEGQSVEEADEMAGGQVDAPVGCGAAEGRFIREPVNIDIPGAGVDGAAAVEAGFESVEPENAMGDGGVGQAGPDEPDGLAGTEGGADGPTLADLGTDPVESERGLPGVTDLTDAEAGGGREETAVELVRARVVGIGVGMPDVPAEFLAWDGGHEQMRRWSDAVAAAGDPPRGGWEHPGVGLGGGQARVRMRTLERRPLAS